MLIAIGRSPGKKNSFILPKHLSKAQLTTEGIVVVSPGSSFAKVLGAFANVSAQLTDLSGSFAS